MHRRSLAAGAIVSLVLTVAACSKPSESEWADFKLAVGHCNGAWQLAPANANRVPGAPECISALAISVALPDALPAGFSLADPHGTATVAFCGQPESFEIKSVFVGNLTQPQPAGIAEPTELGNRVYVFCCAAPNDSSRSLCIRWLPLPYEGIGTESLLISFDDPLLSQNPQGSAAAFGYSPGLAYVR